MWPSIRMNGYKGKIIKTILNSFGTTKDHQKQNLGGGCHTQFILHYRAIVTKTRDIGAHTIHINETE